MSHSDRASGRAELRIRSVAMLAAFALFLSTVEYLIPRPMPFVRIGLANLAVMIGLIALNTREYSLLVVLKVLGQGIIHGTLISYVFLFSLAGTLSSALVMYLLYRTCGKRITFVGISVAGATVSNSSQLILAGVLLFGRSAWLIAPPFLIMGLVTSVLLGLFAEQFAGSSRWLADQEAPC